MNDGREMNEEEVTRLAKVAGITPAPQNRRPIASLLAELRTGVMRADRSIPADAGPATVFDARWEQ